MVETIFRIPGLGQAAIGALFSRDYPMVQAVGLLYAAVFIGINFLVDLGYAVLDPADPVSMIGDDAAARARPGAGRASAGARSGSALLQRDRTTVLAGLLVALIVAGSLILPAVPAATATTSRASTTPSRGRAASTGWAPTSTAWDLLTRLAQGGRISLVVGVVTVLAEVLPGRPPGRDRRIRRAARSTNGLMRLTDMMLAFPRAAPGPAPRGHPGTGRDHASSRPSRSLAGRPWPARCAARC